MTPLLAIIGRPNVGKSTLFNRLTGRRRALVDDTPGVTRDRKIGEASLGGLAFRVVDTPGLEEADAASLEGMMTAQSLAAIADADAILFVVDGKEGVIARDRHFAAIARKSGKPVILAVNKADVKNSHGAADGYALGFGEPIAVSAEHGLGMGELYEALEEAFGRMPDAGCRMSEGEEDEEGDDDKPLRITVVGRPNVGKSSLINRLLGEERLLAGPMAGMTRDAIEVPFAYDGRELLLVDTAGMRRKARVVEKLEAMSVKETTEALRFAEVAILVLDAAAPMERQDNAIAGLIAREGRACVIALNKWDTVAGGKEWLTAARRRAEDVMPGLKGLAIVPVAATTGEGLDALMKEVFRAHARWNRRVATSDLNRWLEAMTERHPPPLVDGRAFKIRYMTQTKARPPTFALFVNRRGVDDAYLRYLTNGLRDAFGLEGTPIRLLLRTGKNPYEGK